MILDVVFSIISVRRLREMANNASSIILSNKTDDSEKDLTTMTLYFLIYSSASRLVVVVAYLSFISAHIAVECLTVLAIFDISLRNSINFF